MKISTPYPRLNSKSEDDARHGVFLCSHLMYRMSSSPHPKPHCAFDSFPIVSFHPKRLLPIQASVPLDYFPGLVCNERHLISEESLGWILKWVFEADDCTAVQSEGKSSPNPQLVGSGNEEYSVCRGKEQIGIKIQSGCLIKHK